MYHVILKGDTGVCPYYRVSWYKLYIESHTSRSREANCFQANLFPLASPLQQMSNAAPRLEVSSWDGKTLRLDFFITLTEGRKRESGRCMLCLLAWMKIFYHRVDVRGRKKRRGIQGQNNTLPEDDCLQGRRPGFHPWVGKILWRREWLPTPVCLPEECHGQRSLASYGPWGPKESDTTEWLSTKMTMS